MGDVALGENVTIHPSARINVTEYLYIGGHSTIGPECVIEGRDIRIGDEFWMDEGAVIGGGSCFEPQSSLRFGHFGHMGRGAFINTARPVRIGREVGLGMGSRIFTHGAYLSALDGYPVSFAPVTIGDCVWLPGAIVNPGVTIGDNVVVGVNSLVTKSLPSGCLAGGSPARVIREDAYPRPLQGKALEEFWTDLLADYPDEVHVGTGYVRLGDTKFWTERKTVDGPASDSTERFRNHLRRRGIRFYARPREGRYVAWR